MPTNKNDPDPAAVPLSDVMRASEDGEEWTFPHRWTDLVLDMEAALAAALAAADQAHEDARMMQERLTRVVEGSAETKRRLEAVDRLAEAVRRSECAPSVLQRLLDEYDALAGEEKP